MGQREEDEQAEGTAHVEAGGIHSVGVFLEMSHAESKVRSCTGRK